MVGGVRSTILEIRGCCRNEKSKANGHLVDSKSCRHATICHVKGTYVAPKTEKEEKPEKKGKKPEKDVAILEGAKKTKRLIKQTEPITESEPCMHV